MFFKHNQDPVVFIWNSDKCTHSLNNETPLPNIAFFMLKWDVSLPTNQQ